MARMVLHSEHRKRPGLAALSFLLQIGHEKILGNTDAVAVWSPAWKKAVASSRLSFILKNWEKPSSWKTSYTFGWISRNDGLLPTQYHAFLVAFLAAHTPYPDLLLEHESALDDQNLFYDGNDGRIAFFTDSGHYINSLVDRRPLNFNLFTVEHFFNQLLVLMSDR